jgi:hypothetical protein
MLFFRYHVPHRDRADEGGQERRRPTAQLLCSRQYAGWQVDVIARSVGVTIRRQQYRAALRHLSLGLTHSLSGFPSGDAAHEAARRWIDANAIRRRVVALHRRLFLRRRTRNAGER